MQRCVIVGGARIENYAWIRAHLQQNDLYVFCDSGLRHREALGVEPGLIVGDFDSHPQPQLPVETIVLPCEKDDTDTVYAVKEALRRGFADFLLIGVTGGRLDHTLGNLSILLLLDTLRKTALLLDDCSEMSIVSERARVEEGCKYFSLLNIGTAARGIDVRNAKYPLANAEITCEYPYGISNEVLPGRTASITVKEGRLLLIKIFA